MIGRTNAGGGSSVGGKLTVTAPANTNVTAKLGDKVKTRNSGSAGSAVFKGLGQGSWNVSITNSEQTITVPVAITTDYFTTIAFFASKIAVTYPAGSTCTCTNGSTTYTAPNTSGSYTFSVPRTGTWTVKITNGTSTKSQDVSITANGQSVAITLSYWDGELFDNGDQHTAYTGGWSGGNSEHHVDTHIYASGDNKTFFFYTNKKVDVTKFKKLRFTGKITIIGGSCGFGLPVNQFVYDSPWVARLGNNSDLYNGTLDISSISGSYFVGMYSQTGYGTTIDITKVWME